MIDRGRLQMARRRKSEESEHQGEMGICDTHDKPILPIEKIRELSKERNLRCPMCGSII